MYPPTVENFLDQLELGLIESDFYCEQSPGYDTDSPTVREEFGKVIFDRWQRGLELILTEQEFMSIMQRCVAQSSIQRLVEKGLVDVIEDEHGEDVVFLTERGKQYMADKNGGTVPPSALSAQNKFWTPCCSVHTTQLIFDCKLQNKHHERLDQCTVPNQT